VDEWLGRKPVCPSCRAPIARGLEAPAPAPVAPLSWLLGALQGMNAPEYGFGYDFEYDHSSGSDEYDEDELYDEEDMYSFY
jgi:hypothetical protein